jgi:hypothetical protein
MRTKLITGLILLNGFQTVTSPLTAAPLLTIETVLVGNPNNLPDPVDQVGQVAYAYKIGKYDITAGQYVTFLNAVATKPKDIKDQAISAAIENLWIPAMSSTKAKKYVTPGVIQRTGGGRANNPYVFTIQRDMKMEIL